MCVGARQREGGRAKGAPIVKSQPEINDTAAGFGADVDASSPTTTGRRETTPASSKRKGLSKGMVGLKWMTVYVVAMVALRQTLLRALPKQPLADVWRAEVSTTTTPVGHGNSTSAASFAPDAFAPYALPLASDLEAMSDRDLQRALLIEEAEWKNRLAFLLVPDDWERAIGLEAWPLQARTWLRCYLLANLLYVGLGLGWAYYIYAVLGHKLFPQGNMPGVWDVLEQIKVAMLALPFYSALPVLCEHIVEEGYTLAYVRIGEYGWPAYFAFFVAYMACVEYGVYWNHRLLHDLKWGYNALHYIHHKYNKENTLSPFAGLAFHPLDGVLQAVPYFWTLFFVPMHSLTYEIMLFTTAIWTTNIHDCVDNEWAPIMGSYYHTIHHTTYRHNYGQFFVYMDHIFGTLSARPGEKEHDAKTA